MFENLALRHQMGVLSPQSSKRPRLRRRDREFWVWLSQLWPRWRDSLVIVQADTVVRWHRQGWRLGTAQLRLCAPIVSEPFLRSPFGPLRHGRDPPQPVRVDHVVVSRQHGLRHLA